MQAHDPWAPTEPAPLTPHQPVKQQNRRVEAVKRIAVGYTRELTWAEANALLQQAKEKQAQA